MKKTSFYTLRRRNGKAAAELENGWSDGNFFYYHTDGGTWFAIHPGSGLGVCMGDTRKEAAETANTPQMAERIAEVWARDGETLAARFAELINKADQKKMGA